MKVTPQAAAAAAAAPADSTHFRGTVRQQLMHQHEDAVRVLFVRFDAGARSHWHTHDGGQVLHFIEGEGRVQSEGGAIRTVGPGDIVTSEPGEKHWHGAGPGGPATHLAVSVGATRWLEES